MALIHVIIPVYNAEIFINETVESVLKQYSNDHIDILLVDDGSTDRSGLLCDELAKKYMNVSVIHQKNAGVSTARNRGIEHFINCNENDLLCFLDADDLWKEGVFEKNLLTELQEKVDVEVFVFGGINCTEDVSRFSNPYQYKPEIIDGGNGAIWKLQRHFCANLYRLNLLKKWNIRFQEGLKYSEDKIFMMQCAFLAEKINFMPQILHIYRISAKSVMGTYKNLSPMDYYMPIIDGWIASDLFLNSMMSISKKSTDAGFVLAVVNYLNFYS